MADKMEPEVEMKRIQPLITMDAYRKLKYIAAFDRVSMTGEVERLIQDRAARDFPELGGQMKI